MELKLKVLEGKHAGQVVPVTGNKFFIGRAEDCQLRPGSDLISRHHCVIIVEEDYVGVRDLGSKNGTQINSEPVFGERPLNPGDQLKVGPLAFEVILSTGVGGKKKPAVTGGVGEAATRAASNTATSDDIDISQWLTPEPAKPASAGAHETQIVAAAYSNTEEIELSPTKALAAINDADAEGESKDQARGKVDPKVKKEPGKLPIQAANNAKDSRDAAMKILDKMKRRR
jgi:pSer/pThr/pTyr-binding forkhead associated (FHA) protein